MPNLIGKMRERLVIQAVTTGTPAASAEGMPNVVFTNLVTLWAQVEFLNGRELEAMQKINSLILLRATVRYRKNLDEKMRVLWRDKIWNINAILPDPDTQFMALLLSKLE